MPKSQSIRVLCRIRPENAKEKGNGFKPCINVISDNTLRIDQEPSAKEPYHEFTFDHVFPGVTTQNEIFENFEIVKPRAGTPAPWQFSQTL